MAGSGPPPSESRRRDNEPARGDWKVGDGDGWQFGDVPEAPGEMLVASIDAWQTWMTSWFAAHWSPADLPALRQLVRLYDQVERGEFQRMGELRLCMDTYGITPKGQQDRRWKKPDNSGAPAAVPDAVAPSTRRQRLKVV